MADIFYDPLFIFSITYSFLSYWSLNIIWLHLVALQDACYICFIKNFNLLYARDTWES